MSVVAQKTGEHVVSWFSFKYNKVPAKEQHFCWPLFELCFANNVERAEQCRRNCWLVTDSTNRQKLETV
jgi:hypothetical protein